MSFSHYESYQNTGYEWMGSLPSRWSVVRLRYLCTCCDGQRVPLNAEQRAERPGNIAYWGANSIMDYVDGALFDEDLVLLGEDGAPFSDRTKPVAFFSQGPVWPNNHVHVLRPNVSGTGRFLSYALNATDFADFIEGSTRDKLTQGKMNAIPIPWPSYSEQTAIVAFLDRETAKIDALVEEQQRLIELLKEKRQAAISRAVTKGLDTNVRMKGSGIEWLGDVPEHWDIIPLRALFRFVKRQNGDALEVLSVYRDYGVIPKASRDDNINKTPDDLTSYQTVYPGDLVVNKMKAWQGSLGISMHQGITSPDYAVFQPTHNGEPEYLNWLLRCRLLPDKYRSISNGIRPDQWRLEPDRFKELKMPFPPLVEQREIATNLRSFVSHTDELCGQAEEAIDLLLERRSALISAVVTGKIDVRGLVEADAPIPDVIAA